MVNKARWLRFFGPRLRKTIQFADKTIVQDAFGGTINKENCIRAFEQHNKKVPETVPADRLLIFEAAEGWEPLCNFLDLPVPDKPFPHLNAGDATLRKQFRQTVTNSLGLTKHRDIY